MNRKILYAVGDRLLRYVYKNPRRNLVKLVKVGKLVAGKMFPPSTFTKPIEILRMRTMCGTNSCSAGWTRWTRRCFAALR